MSWALRRSGRSSRSLSAVISRPSKRIRPAVGSISRSTSRPSVDLPQPDSPTSASVSPAVERKADAVDRRQHRSRTAEQRAPDDEMPADVLDLEQRPAHDRICSERRRKQRD